MVRVRGRIRVGGSVMVRGGAIVSVREKVRGRVAILKLKKNNTRMVDNILCRPIHLSLAFSVSVIKQDISKQSGRKTNNSFPV